MIEVDRLMVEEYRIELIQMMENAGRNLAHLARDRFLEGDARGKRVVVAAGSGGNGGGALVCARRLHNWGAEVWVVLTEPESAMAAVPAHQLDIVKRMGLPIGQADGVTAVALGQVDMIVDGIIGYSLSGAPRGAAADLIRWANGSGAPILALDVPSGVDGTTGSALEPAMRATATMTLALPKTGLNEAGVEENVGELYLADIGVPPALYAADTVGIGVGDLFNQGDVIRLR
jgi:NAD(P)H-hydrate epimerase